MITARGAGGRRGGAGVPVYRYKPRYNVFPPSRQEGRLLAARGGSGAGTTWPRPARPWSATRWRPTRPRPTESPTGLAEAAARGAAFLVSGRRVVLVPLLGPWQGFVRNPHTSTLHD